jgi:transaldolase/glucose-6-phosphate isomerase
MYLDGLIGPDTVNTVPPATLTAFLEHGEVSESLTKDVDAARVHIQRLGELGISLDVITDELLAAGVKAFADSYDRLLKQIEDKLARLSATPKTAAAKPAVPVLASEPASADRYAFGGLSAAVEAELARLDEEGFVRRIWERDESLWPAPPAGSAGAKDRLGWLSLPGLMADRCADASAFAEQIRSEGFSQAVVLGMGGSVAATAAMHQLLAPGSRMAVIDTIEPETVRSVLGTVQRRSGNSLRNTLFIVASKSGTTAETLELERLCRRLLSEQGVKDASRQFVAITDEGTPLRARASEFRWAFTPPADVGGRFSGLSEFGLIPAVMMGMDTDKIAAAAQRMAELCRAPAAQNPGVRLGVSLGAMAKSGRDKVTIITSPSLSMFGRWAEQMLAESLGKNGQGLVPVLEEPAYEARSYGNDRMFVYVNLEGDKSQIQDALVEEVEASGAPVARISLQDRYELPAEFFRWEFATAVAASSLGVYPFDEPDVASAKVKAADVLKRGWAAAIPEPGLAPGMEQLLKQRRPRDYVAIVAYVPESEDFTQAVARLRAAITGRTGLATTFGYGPRYLHSTGQLHKGGPDSCLVLILENEDRAPKDDRWQPLARMLRAQASGDAQALRERGLRVAYVRIGSSELELTPLQEIAAVTESWRI